jgi:hypothetical protein
MLPPEHRPPPPGTPSATRPPSRSLTDSTMIGLEISTIAVARRRPARAVRRGRRRRPSPARRRLRPRRLGRPVPLYTSLNRAVAAGAALAAAAARSSKVLVTLLAQRDGVPVFVGAVGESTTATRCWWKEALRAPRRGRPRRSQRRGEPDRLSHAHAHGMPRGIAGRDDAPRHRLQAACRRIALMIDRVRLLSAPPSPSGASARWLRPEQRWAPTASPRCCPLPPVGVLDRARRSG